MPARLRLLRAVGSLAVGRRERARLPHRRVKMFRQPRMAGCQCVPGGSRCCWNKRKLIPHVGLKLLARPCEQLDQTVIDISGQRIVEPLTQFNRVQPQAETSQPGVERLF